MLIQCLTKLNVFHADEFVLSLLQRDACGFKENQQHLNYKKSVNACYEKFHMHPFKIQYLMKRKMSYKENATRCVVCKYHGQRWKEKRGYTKYVGYLMNISTKIKKKYMDLRYIYQQIVTMKELMTHFVLNV